MLSGLYGLSKVPVLMQDLGRHWGPAPHAASGQILDQLLNPDAGFHLGLASLGTHCSPSYLCA